MRPINSKTWTRFAEAAKQHLRSKLKELLQTVTKQKVAGTSKDKETNGSLLKVGVVMGSSAWDITADDLGQGRNFEDHQDSIRNIISELKGNFENNKQADVDLIWRSATPLHPHIVRGENGPVKEAIHRIKYMSRRRSADLYEYQKKICEDMNVTFLDVYEAYDLSPGGLHLHATDGMHWKRYLNEVILNWFFST